VDAILQIPPSSEAPTSAAGTNRLYNKSDLIIIISNNNTISVTSGVDVNNQATVISNNQWSLFVNTNGSFYNMRDGATVDPLDINVGALRQWSATNTVLRPLLSSLRGSAYADVSSVYVADERMLSNTVVVTNYTYTTNTAIVTNSSYPGAGTFYPPVTTNTIITTSSSYPSAGTYIPPVSTTNTTSTTSGGYPTNGTYLPPVTTNTTLTTTSNKPTGGTYLGSITTNSNPRSYTYNLISSYSYNLISGYIYNGITGYRYSGITGVTTNITYVTNYIQFAEPGIVLTNGAALPSNGLSVVTFDPAYIVGNWNVTTNVSTNGTPVNQTLQSNTVTNTLPSAIYADAVTILSPAWNPNNSTASLTGGSRNASGDTVTAAILTGIVPSNGSFFSGGVENFVRFQENWQGVNFYYNGSMVEMFTMEPL